MSKDIFVYSTLTADNIYAAYVKVANDLPQVERQVLIRGGTNVADKRLHTPRGVVTKITADELEALKDNHVFGQHVDNGFITWSTKLEDVEKEIVTAGLEGRDTSSPLVPEDYVAGDGQAKPAEIGADDPGKAPAPSAAAPPHPAAPSERRPRA